MHFFIGVFIGWFGISLLFMAFFTTLGELFDSAKKEDRLPTLAVLLLWGGMIYTLFYAAYKYEDPVVIGMIVGALFANLTSG